MGRFSSLKKHPLFAKKTKPGRLNLDAIGDVDELRSRLIQIDAFLRDTAGFLDTLAELEDEVRKRMDDLNRTATLALSQRLSTLERRVGFAPPATLTGVVKPDDFFAALADKRPLKDPGAGKEHGEMTHRIQWWCIATGSGVRDRDVVTVYVQLGTIELGTRVPARQSVWETLVDQGSSRKTANSPDWVISQIMPKGGVFRKPAETRFPRLMQAVVSRERKRGDDTVRRPRVREKNLRASDDGVPRLTETRDGSQVFVRNQFRDFG